MFSGNVMNSGTKNAQSIGFDISFLTKLSDTNDCENKGTLLHFLVEIIEKNHPELLSFADEIMHVDNVVASKDSVEDISKGKKSEILTQMENSIKNLELDFETAARDSTPKIQVISQDENTTDDEENKPVTGLAAKLKQKRSNLRKTEKSTKNNHSNGEKDDQFVTSIGAICTDARYQYDMLKTMAQNMDGLYNDLSEYFVFDRTRYNLVKFMSDIKTFKDQFRVYFFSKLLDVTCHCNF